MASAPPPSAPLPSGACLVTGTGAVTSVGRTAPASCAAIRAGIARPRRMTGFDVLDEETQEPLPVVGHPVKGLTDGFHGLGCWLQLARAAFADLQRRGQAPSAADNGFWENTGLWLVTAYPDDDVFLTESGDAPKALQRFAERLLAQLKVPISARNVALVSRAHAGVAAAVQAAMERLHAGLDRACVLAVDSLFHPAVLRKIAADGRLKAPDAPTGLMPGEAGACLLLERPQSAKRRGAQAQAAITAVAVGREANALFTGKPNTGTGLAACLSEALDRGVGKAPFVGEVCSDMNGEVWRAQEWGSAVARLGKRLAEATLELPCARVGDTGAASGALGTCLAVHALVRGHASGKSALVVSSSEQGELGCLVVTGVGS